MIAALILLFKKKFLIILFFALAAFVFLTPKLHAIHAILKDGEPIPRTVGPIALSMSLETFLKTAEALEAPPAIGQFEDERRFQIDVLPAVSGMTNVICDFFKGILFRIEVNYPPPEQGDPGIQPQIDDWTRRFGAPRVNALPGTRLLFWDDGATRMILQIDEADPAQGYSLTYIDDDLFHRISRERVQRETSGQSSYGK